MQFNKVNNKEKLVHVLQVSNIPTILQGGLQSTRVDILAVFSTALDHSSNSPLPLLHYYPQCVRYVDACVRAHGCTIGVLYCQGASWSQWARSLDLPGTHLPYNIMQLLIRSNTCNYFYCL